MQPFKSLLNQDYLVFDTETTGLSDNAEICEIAVVDGKTGDVVLDTRIKPVGTIELGASLVHGIYAEDIKDAPSWAEVYNDVLPSLFKDKLLVAYNAAFDGRLLMQSSIANNLGDDGRHFSVGFYCAMLEFAQYKKVYDHLRGGCKWFKLADAAQSLGLEPEGDLHGARVDARLTWALIRKIQQGLYNE
jgi:DNA polymerase III epsilon subunit-like protein